MSAQAGELAVKRMPQRGELRAVGGQNERVCSSIGHFLTKQNCLVTKDC